MQSSKKIKKILQSCNLLILVLFCGCTPALTSNTQSNFDNKKFVAEDKIYEDSIKTVQCYPKLNTKTESIQPAIISLAQDIPLILEFDEISTKIKSYYYKLSHYNADWTPSALVEAEYTVDYNEQRILEQQFSSGTLVSYTHYKFVVPKVKVSGNYIIKVYRDGNEADIVLSKRFVVYENSVNIIPKGVFSNIVSERAENQQIDFDISYPNYEIVNPQAAVKVVLRQNFRWDNAVTMSNAFNINEFQKLMIFTSFKGENNFKGNNEYRYFDAQSLLFTGFNVRKISILDSVANIIGKMPAQKLATVQLQTDELRRSYTRLQDLSGGFFINQYETQTGNISSDYVKVYFSLKTPNINEDVFVVGKFNDFMPDATHKLTYDDKNGTYQGSFLLKQGIYNYAYATKKDNKISETTFEGSFQATGNDYEIIVYYRPVGARYDHIIGYKAFKVN